MSEHKRGVKAQAVDRDRRRRQLEENRAPLAEKYGKMHYPELALRADEAVRLVSFGEIEPLEALLLTINPTGRLARKAT